MSETLPTRQSCLENAFFIRVYFHVGVGKVNQPIIRVSIQDYHHKSAFSEIVIALISKSKNINASRKSAHGHGPGHDHCSHFNGDEEQARPGNQDFRPK